MCQVQGKKPGILGDIPTFPETLSEDEQSSVVCSISNSDTA